MGFLCLYRWDGLHPYFLQQIGHRGNSGFTGGFRYISSLAFETVRMVCKSRISEVERCTILTVGVISPRPPKTGVRIRNGYLFLRLTTCRMAK